MIERFGATGTEQDGVFFCEHAVAGTGRGHVRVQIPGQNHTLTQVKQRMAAQAKRKGATAIANFKCGQRRAFWAWDDGKWYGEGDAIAAVEPARE